MDAQTLLLSLFIAVTAATPGCNRQDNIRPKTAAGGSELSEAALIERDPLPPLRLAESPGAAGGWATRG